MVSGLWGIEMSYYNDKKRMQNIILTKIKSNNTGFDQNLLILDIMERFGFGERTVMNYIKYLDKCGLIEIKGGLIRWLEK